MEILEGMLQKEKDNFGRVCNRLLEPAFCAREIKTPEEIIILF